MTISSKSPSVWSRMLVIARRTYAAALYTGTQTEISGVSAIA